MKVSELVQELSVVAPTLSAGGPVPMMTHFWFIDGHVTTFNDRLAMSKPLDLGFDFTAPGMLLDMLKVSYQAGKVTFTEGKEGNNRNVRLRIGDGDQKNTFDSFDTNDATALFEMPKPSFNAPAFADNLGKTQNAIDTCMLAISSDQLQPERCGITIIPEDKWLALYAFNNVSMARCVLPLGDTKFKDRLTVPTDFWSILQGLVKGMVVKDAKRMVQVSLKEKEVIAKVDDVLLFAKPLPVDQPTDLHEIFTRHYTAKLKGQLLPLTQDIGEALDRHLTATKGDDDVFTEVSVTDGVLKITTNAKNGYANDTIDFDHPDVKLVKIKVEQLAKGYKQFERIAISTSVVVMTNAERVFMVSAKS